MRAPVGILAFFFVLIQAASMPAGAGAGAKKSHGKKDGKAADAIIKSGEQAYLAGSLEEALSIFKKAIKKHPDDHRGYYYAGMILAEQGAKDEAEKMYRASLERNPALPEALNNLAVLVQEKKKWKEAETLLLAALKAAPDYYEARFNIGYLYEEWGKAGKAVEAYRKAAEMNAGDTDALIALAEIEAGRGKPWKAIEAYRKAVKRNSSLAALKINIAALLVKVGKKKKAAEELESLLSMIVITEGADLAVAFRAARGLRLAGKPERTLEILAKFPSDAKKTFSVQAEIGQCRLALGNCHKAAKAFEAALKIKPGSAEALLACADAFFCAKNCKKAVKYYKKFLDAAPGSDDRREAIRKKIEKCR